MALRRRTSVHGQDRPNKMATIVPGSGHSCLDPPKSFVLRKGLPNGYEIESAKTSHSQTDSHSASSLDGYRSRRRDFVPVSTTVAGNHLWKIPEFLVG